MKKASKPATATQPAPVPGMPGAHNYDGAPDLPFPPASILLGQIAAPFAAAGMPDAEAVKRAYALALASDIFLMQRQTEDLFNNPLLSVDLDRAVRDLQRDRKTLKKYLHTVLGNGKADDLWKSALKGERVFTCPLMRQLKEERDRAYRERANRQGKTAKN